MTQNPVTVTQLRSQHPAALIGLPGDAPLLRWSIESKTTGLSQLGYEIEASATQSFESTIEVAVGSGPKQFGIEAPGGSLASREQRFYRVRVETEAGWYVNGERKANGSSPGYGEYQITVSSPNIVRFK